MARADGYVCESCGHDESKWLGRCPSCGEWNTIKKISIGSSSVGGGHASATRIRLSDVHPEPPERHPTGIEEFDRVLGGGLSPGTTVLLGGEPGIGKSTLMLQLAGTLPGKGLYVSGEESPEQLRTRADRLTLKTDSLEILCETDLDALINAMSHPLPAFAVVDSIQTLVSSEAGSVPGTPNQLKIAAHRLTSWAKTAALPLFLVAHVTKEGIIAGPKVIEHLVDTVLYFDHASGDLRVLRASKNRLGSVEEMGLFRMESSGLTPIADPSGLFLEQRRDGPPVGSAVTAIYEGSRVLLVEIQALVVPAKGGPGRVYSDRIDNARVSRIAAVLERHASLRLSDQDIYVNVAGGLRITDTGADLALALALASARAEKPLAADLVAVGEVSLAGEVRTVPHMRRRIKTAVESGLLRWITAFGVDDSGTLPGNGRERRSIREAAADALCD